MQASDRIQERPPYGDVWRLAWPLILSNITVPMLGMVDSAVVGHLPEPHHLGAVALGAISFSILYLVFGSVRMGTTALTAQAAGAEDGEENRACLIRPLSLAFLFGLGLIMLGPYIAHGAALAFQPTDAVNEELRNYMEIRIFGAPAAVANFVLLGWLLGNHDTRSQLLVLLVTNGVNVVLDLWFVFGFGWGVSGVAAATVIAEFVGLSVALYRARLIWVRLPAAMNWLVVKNTNAYARLFKVNGDLVIRTLFLEICFVVFAALSARQGEVILAANAVLEHFLMLQAYALDGFAFAAEALVGRAVGRRSQAELDRNFRAAAVWSLGFAVIILAVFWLAGPAIVRLITSIDSVQSVAFAFMPYLIVSPLLGVWAYLFDGVFSGATQTAELRNGTAVACLVFMVAAFTLPSFMGNHGLWVAVLIWKTFRGAWFWWRYRTLRDKGVFVARMH